MRCARHDRSIVLENKMPLEPRVGFCRRGRGRAFHVQETKTEKAREPTVRAWYEEAGGRDIRSRAETT